MSTDNLDSFLTSADVAKILGLTPAAVRAAARDGRLRIAGNAGSRIRLFRREDVERFGRMRARQHRHNDREHSGPPDVLRSKVRRRRSRTAPG
jgi:hypothetical protein